MKHPALARVFSVVLAILGLLLLANGISGFRKNEKEHAERLAYAEKFAGKIDRYVELQAQLDRSADYTEIITALDTLMAEHEKAASQHKTDTAIYTATKGGLKMGEDMIIEARAQMRELQGQLRNASSRKAVLESMLAELIANNKNNMPWLDALSNKAGACAGRCYMAAQRLAVLSAEIRSLMEMEPDPRSFAGVSYVPPEGAVPDDAPVPPTLDESYIQDVQEAAQISPERYQEAVMAYQEALNRYAVEMQEYYQRLAEYELARQQQAMAHDTEEFSEEYCTEEYKQAHKAWEKLCERVKSGANFSTPIQEIRQMSAALSTLVRQANSMAADLVAETGGVFPELDELMALSESTAARLEQFSAAGLATMSNEDFVRAAEEAERVLTMLGEAFFCTCTTLNNPAGLIAEIMEQLHITENLMPYIDAMMARAEAALYTALSELWYQLGELDKDALRLEAEKLGLDREAELLTREGLQADELRELHRNHSAARMQLLAVPEVKAASDAGADLAESARTYLASYRVETERLFNGKRLINALAVASGVFAVLGVPAAYELIRKRAALLLPPTLCLLCAAASDGLNMYLGQGQKYAALFTAIFALLDLMIIAPQKRRAGRAARH